MTRIERIYADFLKYEAKFQVGRATALSLPDIAVSDDKTTASKPKNRA